MFFIQSIIFLSLVFLVLFLPGYFLILAIWGRKKIFSRLERVVISFGLGLISLDFLFFLFDFLNIKITQSSSFLGVSLFLMVTFLIFKLRAKKEESFGEKKRWIMFSRNEIGLILLLIFSIFFIKTIYLSGTISPTSTDMGHHMYWAKEMAETGILPRYEGMPDFIIGEHIVFGLFNVMGNLSFFGAFSISLLYLFNLLSLLASFILALRIFKNKKIAILSLLFLGVLFAISSPQAKFVSGGVIGNIIGNFLLPLALYFYVRTFNGIRTEIKNIEERRKFLALATFVTFGLFYTHHLTSFIFLFSFLGALIIFLLLNWFRLKIILKNIFRIIFSWPVGIFLVMGIIFFFFIFTPNYASFSAVDTAVGSPIKETRTGLSLTNIFSMVGELRVILGILGVGWILFHYREIDFGKAVILGWAVMLFIMSMKPQWLFIDLPNSRVGNYLTYPLSILSAYFIFEVFLGNWREKSQKIGKVFFSISLSFILMALLLVGIYDSLVNFKNQKEDSHLSQVFNASKIVASQVDDGDMLLKDHNYLTGDAWIKLFFMRGYRFPLSRSYFKRYEDPNNPREMCTLYMISEPASSKAQDCFSETKTDFLMVNPLYDESQFRRLFNFDRIYSSSQVTVFYKKK